MNPKEAETFWSNLQLRTWKRGNKIAVNKPLLLLLLISKAIKKENRFVAFSEITEKLEALLKEFGSSASSHHSEYPFWHMQGDSFWILKNIENIAPDKSPSKKTLLKNGVVGSILEELWIPLCENVSLQEKIVDKLLYSFWPKTLHPSIRQAIDLPVYSFDEPETLKRKRATSFREEVLRAYEKRCVICDYDGRISNSIFGLDAVHIQWFAYNGPDSLQNGLALCSFHHIALDRGALGVSDQYQILISSHLSGQKMLEELLYNFIGKELRSPQQGFSPPALKYIQWHRKNVFKEPAIR